MVRLRRAAVAAAVGRRVAVSAAVGLGLLAVGGCGSGDHHGPSPSPARNVSVDRPALSFRLHLNEGEDLEYAAKPSASPSPSPSSASSDCNVPADWVELERDGESVATFEADPRPCAPGGRVSGNGRHAMFHSTADMTKEQRAQAHTFPVHGGTAVEFGQPYYECTNSCKNWTEPVIHDELDAPADPAHPTLVIRSEKAALSQDALKHLVTDRLTLPTTASPPRTASTPPARS